MLLQSHPSKPVPRADVYQNIRLSCSTPQAGSVPLPRQYDTTRPSGRFHPNPGLTDPRQIIACRLCHWMIPRAAPDSGVSKIDVHHSPVQVRGCPCCKSNRLGSNRSREHLLDTGLSVDGAVHCVDSYGDLAQESSKNDKITEQYVSTYVRAYLG